jgi:transposase
MTKGGRGRNARPRRQFSDEFKAGAVRLVIEEERPIRQVARELDIVPSALDRWVKKEEARRGISRERPAPIELTVDERAELQELRKRVRELEVDKAILKKAAAFFAKENA